MNRLRRLRLSGLGAERLRLPLGLTSFLAVVGPGVITGFAGNDAGGVTTYTAVGARYGFALLWLLLFSTAGLLFIQEMCARMGAVTGKGLSDLIRENFGVRWTLVAMAALFVANGSNVVAEFAGIAASLELLGIPRALSVPVSAAAIWAIVIFFSYRVVERTLFVLLLAFVAYPVSAFVVGPEWLAVGRGLVLPASGGDGAFSIETGVVVAALALVGTTITPYMQFYIQSSIVDKGIDLRAYHLARIDVLLGAVLTGLNGFFIIVVAGSVLFPAGVIVESAEEAARALAPLAGPGAQLLFGIGLFGASILAATVMPLSTAYAVTEAFGWESGISKRFHEAPIFMGLFTSLIAAGALLVAFTDFPLIPLILLSQNVNGLLLPVILVFILRLAGDRRLMGAHANGPAHRVAGIAVVGVASTLSLALVGLSLLQR
jgi:Mn2+/Fe2+ NRAMP family transporter